jgi:hypothetical protein
MSMAGGGDNSPCDEWQISCISFLLHDLKKEVGNTAKASDGDDDKGDKDT